MNDLHPDADEADDLQAQRNGFLGSLVLVLKDLWPDARGFELKLMDKDGKTLREMGGTLPPKGYWG